MPLSHQTSPLPLFAFLLFPFLPHRRLTGLEIAWHGGYIADMNEVKLSTVLEVWLSKLRDGKGKAIILGRLRRASYGNFGDVKNLGAELWEMRIHFGPGYRLYYTQEGNSVYFFLAGGDKSTQGSDIITARKLLEEGNE